MPRKQVLASPQDVQSLLSEWEKEDRALARERGHWRTQMNRDAKSTVRAARGTPVADSVTAAVRSSTLQKELEWVQIDLATDQERVKYLRRVGASSEHVLAYERRIAARRIHMSRLLSQVA
jgi:hypothetical protein